MKSRWHCTCGEAAVESAPGKKAVELSVMWVCGEKKRSCARDHLEGRTPLENLKKKGASLRWSFKS
jgi:hypothetical protein